MNRDTIRHLILGFVLAVVLALVVYYANNGPAAERTSPETTVQERVARDFFDNVACATANRASSVSQAECKCVIRALINRYGLQGAYAHLGVNPTPSVTDIQDALPCFD